MASLEAEVEAKTEAKVDAETEAEAVCQTGALKAADHQDIFGIFLPVPEQPCI